MPPPSGVKLRESCDPCAASKVKCSKDKPTCNRCSERGITCNWKVTQKTGRKLRRREPKDDNVEYPTPADTGTSPSTSTSPTSSKLDSTTRVSLFDPQFGAVDPDISLYPNLDDFMSSLPMNSDFSSPMTTTASLATHATPPEYTHEAFAAVSCAPDQGHASLQLSESSLPGSNSTGRDSLEFLTSLTCSFPNTDLSQVGDVQSLASSQHADGLRLALRLMAQLSSRDEGNLVSASPASTGYEQQTSTAVSQLQTVIDKNKSVMETVGSILQSPAFQDGYCLVVLCLIISKVLNTYTSAVHSFCARDNEQQQMRASAPSTFTAWAASIADPVAGTTPKSERADLVAVQRVLDELYQIQASVDQLGARMRQCAKRNWSFGIDAFPVDNNTSPIALPFSATVLDQLYSELRKRLSAVSLELIDELKRFWI